MRPTTAHDPKIFDLTARLHSGTRFNRPSDVLKHPTLSIAEKRSILASWASDAAAVASCPSLRAPEELKAPVSIDDILAALRALDDHPRHPPGGKPNRVRSTDRTLAA
nr:alpha/beta hydrolase fold protein [uncultured bacterium]